ILSLTAQPGRSPALASLATSEPGKLLRPPWRQKVRSGKMSKTIFSRDFYQALDHLRDQEKELLAARRELEQDLYGSQPGQRLQTLNSLEAIREDIQEVEDKLEYMRSMVSLMLLEIEGLVADALDAELRRL